VPEAIRVEYRGRLPFGLTGKDVILKTLGELKRNTVAMERTVEYVGDALEHFSTDFRFTVANMTAEFGGLNGIFPADERTAELLAKRKSHNDGALFFRADDAAQYAATHSFDLRKLVPQVAKPFSPDNVFDIGDAVGQALDGVFIGACNTTEEELVLSALVLREAMAAGKTPKKADGDKRIVVPGSREIAESLKKRGLLEIFVKAGFRVGVPGCSMCLGIASDKAGPGEHWLTSQNRNFENRMGAGSIAYLSSGPTVAASAFDLKIADPRPYLAKVGEAEVRRFLDAAPSRPRVVVAEPEKRVEASAHGNGHGAAATSGGDVIRGKAQLFGDHVDTDAMIPGEFCHLTDSAEIGKVAFHYVRPDFGARIARGEDVLVAGEGWGSGSSREHAVWALKFAGVKAVIAKSYAFIHKRNLVNEAVPFFVLDDPEFHAAVKDGDPISIAVDGGVVTLRGREFRAHPAGGIASRIQSAGGLVLAVQRYGKETFDILMSGAPATK
jgi:aconitate hydratase/homoaconitate hydratase